MPALHFARLPSMLRVRPQTGNTRMTMSCVLGAPCPSSWCKSTVLAATTSISGGSTRGFSKSWAVPKGLPESPGPRHLAIETEDHPLAWAEFEGEIEEGEYGAGTVEIWDRGDYELEEWTDGAIVFTLDGARSRGRYCLLRFPRAGERHWLLFLATGGPPRARQVQMKTTDRGYVNRNGQVNLGRTEPPRAGTDFGQVVYVMRCPTCRRNYGVNGTDVWQRKCPFHQLGQPGLPLTADETRLQ